MVFIVVVSGVLIGVLLFGGVFGVGWFLLVLFGCWWGVVVMVVFGVLIGVVIGFCC